MTDVAQLPLDEQIRLFFSHLPHGNALGVEVLEAEQGMLQARVPFSDFMVGNPVTGFIHGGVITALIDQTSGTAASFVSEPPQQVATLDLRIDHLSVAESGLPVHARAECYKATKHICFVRCTAYTDREDRPIATSVSSFMKIGPLFRGRRKQG